MINRDEFARALEEIRDLRALLAFERDSHDTLRQSVESRSEGLRLVAAGRLRESRGRLSVDWVRDNEEHAALLNCLRGSR